MKDEQIKIQRALKIPISNIAFNNEYVSIYSNHKHIGNIRTINDDSKLDYDLKNDGVNTIDWSSIYSDNKDALHNLIVLLFDNALEEDRIMPGPFRRLYIRQDDQSVRTIECAFEDGEWKVLLLDY